MASNWPALHYEGWAATCETLHAHVQVLGKLALALAPSEPEFQHAALLLSVRGWETRPLPAPDGSGAFAAMLDLREHVVRLQHTDGRVRRIPLTPNRPVADVTRDVLDAVGDLVGSVQLNLVPQETPWRTPLDEDTEHASYDETQVDDYLQAANRAALVLTEFRAPYRGRSTRLNAWWGSFDLAVNLFSGAPADPPANGYIMRTAMDAQEIAVGWWPGHAAYPRAAFYAYAHPAPAELAIADLSPGRWDPKLGEFVLDWDDALATADPHATALSFARNAARHACLVCAWPAELAASLE